MKKLLLILIICLFWTSLYAADHELTKLPLNAVGYTDLDALTASGYDSARVLFVSSTSGNDTTATSNIGSNGHYGVSDLTFDSDGFFLAPGGVSAFATIATAYAYCRDGSPDILLLERGSTWSAGIGISYVNSGSAQTTPHIIASYGASGVRPKLTDVIFNSLNQTSILYSGIHFYSVNWSTAGRAYDIRGTATYQTIEDCVAEQKSGDIMQGSGVDTIVFRRSIWIHSEAHDGQLFLSDASNIVVEECIFAEPYDDSYTYPWVPGTNFGRNIYFAHGASTGVILRHNIFFAADRTGIDLRVDGTVYDNLVVQGLVSVGDVGTGARYALTADVSQNVLMEGSPRTGEPTVMEIYGNEDSTISHNILTDNDNVVDAMLGISLLPDSNGTDPDIIDDMENIEIFNNIVYGYAAAATTGYALKFSSSFDTVSNISIHDNDFQMTTGHGSGAVVGYGDLFMSEATFANNNYYSTESESDWFYQGTHAEWVTASSETGSSKIAVTYTAPTRTIRTYNQTLGGTADTEDFMADAITSLSRDNFDSDYTANAVNNYIRAGFDKSAVSISYTVEDALQFQGITITGGTIE